MESVLENKLMNAYKNEMISFLKSHPEYFEEAIQLAISDKQPYSWRVSFLLWDCMEEIMVLTQDQYLESLSPNP